MISSIIAETVNEIKELDHSCLKEDELSKCLVSLISMLDDESIAQKDKADVLAWLRDGGAHQFSASYEEVMRAHLMAMRESWSVYDQSYKIVHSAINFSTLWIQTELKKGTDEIPNHNGVRSLFDIIALLLLDDGGLDDELSYLIARHECLRWYQTSIKGSLKLDKIDEVIKLAKECCCSIGRRGDVYTMEGHTIETVICTPGQTPVLHHEVGDIIVRHLTIFTNVYSLFEQGALNMGDLAIRRSRTNISHLSLCVNIKTIKMVREQPWVLLDISKEGLQATSFIGGLDESIKEGVEVLISIKNAFHNDIPAPAKIKWIRKEGSSVFIGVELTTSKVEDSYLKILQKRI